MLRTACIDLMRSARVHAQGRPSVRAKLVICSSGSAAPAARAVQGSPLGRGRIALLAPGAALTPPQPDGQEVHLPYPRTCSHPTLWHACSVIRLRPQNFGSFHGLRGAAAAC